MKAITLITLLLFFSHTAHSKELDVSTIESKPGLPSVVIDDQKTCVNRVTSDINYFKELTKQSYIIKKLNKTASIYSYCSFAFQNKGIFFLYQETADAIDIMAIHLELHDEEGMPSKFSEDKTKIIELLEKIKTNRKPYSNK